jgi:hypothetical protein
MGYEGPTNNSPLNLLRRLDPAMKRSLMTETVLELSDICCISSDAALVTTKYRQFNAIRYTLASD